jgi:hypothetical protein
MHEDSTAAGNPYASANFGRFTMINRTAVVAPIYSKQT